MNNTKTIDEDTNPTDTGYQEWLAECEDLATDAGFRGLLKAYFAGHPSEDYGDLAIGAQEILSHVMDGLLEEDQDEDVCAHCRLMDLIFPEPEPEANAEKLGSDPSTWGVVPQIVQ